MKHRVSLTIHREDHKVDALGLVFLGAIEREKTLSLLRGYLGPHATLHRVELDDAVLRVEVDVRDFPEESQNLVRSARELLRRGVVRGATQQLEEALRLSPLNVDALKTLGRLYYRQRNRDAARHFLTRAREVAPADTEILRLLAEIALHEGRRLAAREYLEQLLRADPGERHARRSLARLEPTDLERIRGALQPGPAASSNAPERGNAAVGGSLTGSEEDRAD
jgi:cytochrome c-type biogenesis protein CcmH/NrfG